MKQSKPQDTNVKLFMQTEAYAQLRETLQFQINNNSQAFNLKIPQPSNLMEYEAKTKMSASDRKALKVAKREYKLLPDHNREKVIEMLVQSPMPNWNIRFSERRKVN